MAFSRLIPDLELHDGQALWLENHARTKIACCGRRWGKSLSESVDLLWFAFAVGQSTQFLVAPTADQATTIFRYAEQMLYRSPLLYPHVTKLVRKPFPEIVLDNDAAIHVRSAGNTGQNVRSHGADRLILDEAAFIPEAARTALSPLLATSEHAQQVYISTPFGLNFFHDLYRQGEQRSAEYASFHFPSESNPHVSRAYLRQQRLEMTDLQYRVEYGAEFVEDQNAVFPWSLIQSCLDPSIETEPMAGHRYGLGWDPAEYQDRSGLVCLDITERPWRVVRAMDIAGRGYEDQEHQITLLSEQYHRARGLMDASHGSAGDPLLRQINRAGVRVEGFQFTNESKRELINGLLLSMEQGELRIPPLPLLLEELRYYRYEHTPAGNVKLGADEKHHDDLVTALALAVHHAKSARRPGMGAASL